MPVDTEDALRLPPHSVQAEQSVLGSLLLDSSTAARVRELVCADDFYSDAHREIFRHIERVLASERPLDFVLVCESLDGAGRLEYVGGMPYLGSLVQNVPTAANAAHYASIVSKHARLRAVIATTTSITDQAFSASADAATLLADAHERLEGLATVDDAELAPLDLAAIATAAVPERCFRVGRIMPMGAPGLWTGHGGAGKTQTALHLAICIALGRPFFGEDVAGARVAYVSTEDDAADLHYRLAQQVRVLGATIAELEGRLFLYDLTARDPVIATALADGSVTPTPRYAWLRGELRRRGVGVVFLDNFATLCAVDLIRPAHATQAMALCAQLVPADGNAVLIAHVDKVTAKAGHSREAYSGTAAFHNRARWRWFLFAPNSGADAEDGEEPEGDDGRRVLEVQKVNAGRSGARIALRILDNGAIAAPESVDSGLVAGIARRNERAAVLVAVKEAETREIRVAAARHGPSTAFDVLPAMPSYPEGMRGKSGKRRLLTLLMQMRAEGELVVREITSGGHKREFLFPARVCE